MRVFLDVLASLELGRVSFQKQKIIKTFVPVYMSRIALSFKSVLSARPAQFCTE